MPETRYIDALLNDLSNDLARYAITRPIHSIFIGGGTPSLFQPESINRLLCGIAKQMDLENGLEITLEANPGTFESAKFTEFRALGINRLSIGIQSFNDVLLARLGRVHNAAEAIHAVEIAHSAGFENFNLDLMFGLPGASIDDSKNDIEMAINLQPKHISFYQLTLEPNTYFHRFPPKLPDDDAIFAAQKTAQNLLADFGYQQYEVSAYSQSGFQCLHNLNYWQFGDYLGIGAGAHGKITQTLPDEIFRTCKTKNPERYLNKTVVDNAIASKIATGELALEFVMNHLRLKRGFSPEHYKSVTGLDMLALESGLACCVEQGLLVYQNSHYVCSEYGWNYLDNILEKFIT